MEFEVAVDGIEALEKLKSDRYAVGIYDILMPNMDGIELLALTTEIDPDMQVIMITGNAQIGMVIEALKRGAFAFLRKPFEYDDFLHEIRKAMKQRELIIENRNYHHNLEKIVAQRTSELQRSQAELKLEKEKLENVLESLGVGLQVSNTRGETIWSNRIASTWFGQIEHLGKFHLRDASIKGEEEICLVSKTGFPQSRNLTLKCLDGIRREFSLGCSPIRDREGEIVQVVTLIQDVTEQKRLERELLHSERLASMGEIAAGLAHEINNPIGVILGLVQNILVEIDENHPYYNDLKIVESEIFRTNKVIKSLLEFAREPKPVIKEVNIIEVCRSSLNFLDYLFQEKGLIINFRPGTNIPKINGDQDQLKQVIVNILLNSLYATPEGGTLSLTVETEKMAGERGLNYLRIEISDTGAGISEEDLPHIFNPFFTTKGKKGSGLGLSICKRIIEGHGGTINIQSEVNKGTKCLIRLPI
jgi:C4-dicarboxylate-specific signal transduction histidine kinase